MLIVLKFKQINRAQTFLTQSSRNQNYSRQVQGKITINKSQNTNKLQNLIPNDQNVCYVIPELQSLSGKGFGYCILSVI
jgi:hypothetical protein